MFTLNTGPSSRDASRAWTTDNARSLVAYAASHNDPVRVWELGNEINGYPVVHGFFSGVSGDQYVADFTKAKALVQSLMPGTKLAGPSSAFWPLSGEFNPMLADFLAKAGSLVDIVTWHYYPMQSVRCPLAELRASADHVLDPEDLDNVARWAAAVERARDTNAPSAEVWLGETGGAQCGGQPNVSDTFVGSFWWVDQLGLLARRGEPVTVRQSLSGASYGLLDEDTLEPRPDYYVSVAFRRLAGHVALAATVSDPENLFRAYAHCTPPSAPGYSPGAVTLIGINLDRRHAARIRLEGATAIGAEVYLFTASDLTSRVPYLNHQPLRTAADGTPPPLVPASLEGETLTLPNVSYAFAILPNARAEACLP
jgi:heparanase 1